MSAADRARADADRIAAWRAQAAVAPDIPLIPAATVVVLRDGDDGVETLMLRKNSKLAFGGMWVFPGGRIDPEDWSDHSDEVAAARAAASREAHEEAAVSVTAESMVMFAHWVPPLGAPKRFSTWFFAAPVASRHAVIDDGEIVAMDWLTPTEAKTRHHHGDIELAPPTWVTLHTIEGHASVDAALAALASRPPRFHATKISRGPDGPVVLWEGDSAYESGDAREGGGHRLTMRESGYHYDDSAVG